MDGLLLVDKPSGPTSHDIVARVRRLIGERRIGHTGTLDPMASGVLPLVLGRATRLARFLSADSKTYDAVVRLGANTDTYDAQGEAVGTPWSGALPERDAIEAALRPFRGTFWQQPPAYSAKKIAGRRSYDLAREGNPSSPLPDPVAVTVHRLDLLDVSGPRVTLRLACSSGFYVRSLAHDLGATLGTGAHLAELRRIEAAGLRIEHAVPLSALEGPEGRAAAERALIPIDHMLETMPAVALTNDGVDHVRFGRELGPADAAHGFPPMRTEEAEPHVRLLAPDGRLVGLGAPSATPGLLHPAVVLM
jgi:tRNA pseudouridine55 synthase